MYVFYIDWITQFRKTRMFSFRPAMFRPALFFPIQPTSRIEEKLWEHSRFDPTCIKNEPDQNGNDIPIRLWAEAE
jgi:hypothetical protein